MGWSRGTHRQIYLPNCVLPFRRERFSRRSLFTRDVSRLVPRQAGALPRPVFHFERSHVTLFSELGLQPPLMKALTQQGYDEPTPIQTQAIPELLKDRDLLGIAQTGTGKTAAFALPTLNKLLASRRSRQRGATRVLVLAPTRELAGQIADSFRLYSQFMDCVTQTVFGGVKIGHQIRSLQKGTDILVATPGRLLDLMSQGAVTLEALEVLILDEADQMLDMGFIHDLNKIVAAIPDERQTLMFSATMPKLISDLAQRFLRDPVRVSITPESTTAERVEQSVIHVGKNGKLAVLGAVLSDPSVERALVFARTKHGADAVVRKLLATGHKAAAIHGNKSQPQRMRALEAFKAGPSPILVATDIAARGIDVDGVSHVINFEMPNIAEQYVHRIGRTARAGRMGQAVSLVAEDELYYLRDIERTIRIDLDVLPVPASSGVEGLPVPDRSFRPPKPKGPAGGRGSNRRSSAKSSNQKTRSHGRSGRPPSRRSKSGGKARAPAAGGA